MKLFCIYPFMYGLLSSELTSVHIILTSTNDPGIAKSDLAMTAWYPCNLHINNSNLIFFFFFVTFIIKAFVGGMYHCIVKVKFPKNYFIFLHSIFIQLALF